MASTMILPRSQWTIWAPGFWGGICSDRCAVPGKTSPGRAGGGIIRRTTRRYLYSRITRARPLRWTAARPFTLSPMALSRPYRKRAAKGKDVRIGGGVATIRQYLTAGQIDEIHLAMSPIFLGEGEHLFAGLNFHALGFTSIKTVASEKA